MSYTNGITIKDIQKGGLNVLNNSIIDNVFLKDHKRAYLYKKAEKLSQAVHVVLAHTKTVEGITDKLSQLSIKLIGEVLHNQVRGAGSTLILEIISILQIGETAGIIAPKNAELLVREYGYLLALSCESKMQDIDLDTEIESVEQRTVVNTPKSKIVQEVKSTQENAKGHSGDRKGHVLEMIKEQGNLGIKDIAHRITDCSEKTIQRLLNTLIAEGSIRKEGERRWSTYHYAL